MNYFYRLEYRTPGLLKARKDFVDAFSKHRRKRIVIICAMIIIFAIYHLIGMFRGNEDSYGYVIFCLLFSYSLYCQAARTLNSVLFADEDSKNVIKVYSDAVPQYIGESDRFIFFALSEDSDGLGSYKGDEALITKQELLEEFPDLYDLILSSPFYDYASWFTSRFRFVSLPASVRSRIYDAFNGLIREQAKLGNHTFFTEESLFNSYRN